MSNGVHKLKLSELIPNPVNRLIDADKVRNIERAIKESGRIKPLVYTEVMTDRGKKNMLTDGHHRYVALKRMGYATVPVIMADERGVESAKKERPRPVSKAERRPCPDGYYRDKDGKCRRRAVNYGGSFVYKPPSSDEDGPDEENGGSNDPSVPKNGSTQKMALEVQKHIRHLSSTIDKALGWDESKHSRDQKGRFASTGAGKNPPTRGMFGAGNLKPGDLGRLETEFPGITEFYNRLPEKERPGQAMSLIAQFSGLRARRKTAKRAEVIRDIVSKLNRLIKTEVSDVQGLSLVREDLEGGHKDTRRRTKKLNVGIGTNPRRPYKNPDSGLIEGDRI